MSATTAQNYHTPCPAAFKDAFSFVLVSPPPGGSVEGSGFSFSIRDGWFSADSGPDPGGEPTFYFCILALSAAGRGTSKHSLLKCRFSALL